MNDVYKCIEDAAIGVDRLIQILKRKKTLQVRSNEEKSIVKATALAWFNNYSPIVDNVVDIGLLNDIDELFKKLLSAGDLATTRSKYKRILKSISKALLDIRSHVLVNPKEVTHTSDSPPDFAILIAEHKMQEILANRWRECTRCVSSDAPLAATVMMGGLLEALLLSRFNKEADK